MFTVYPSVPVVTQPADTDTSVATYVIMTPVVSSH